MSSDMHNVTAKAHIYGYNFSVLDVASGTCLGIPLRLKFILLHVPFLSARCHGMPGASFPFDAIYMASLWRSNNNQSRLSN